MVLKKSKDAQASKTTFKGGNPVKMSYSEPQSSSQNQPILETSTLTIDYPSDGEVLKGIHYSIRLATSGPGTPQISFDGTDWKNCRNDGGYWWYDWAYFTPGSYKISARLIDNSGKVLKRASTRVRVA